MSLSSEGRTPLVGTQLIEVQIPCPQCGSRAKAYMEELRVEERELPTRLAPGSLACCPWPPEVPAGGHESPHLWPRTDALDSFPASEAEDAPLTWWTFAGELLPPPTFGLCAWREELLCERHAKGGDLGGINGELESPLRHGHSLTVV